MQLHKAIIAHLAPVFLLTGLITKAQNNDSVSYYMESQIVVGKVVPNYRKHPPTGLLYGIDVTLGRIDQKDTPLNRFYNFPGTGVNLGYHSLGSDSIYGKAFSFKPVAEFDLNPLWSCKIGLGVSYFTKSFRENPINKSVGSNLAWGFDIFIRKRLDLNDRTSLLIGGGFMHGSNGHVQLPNYGLNGALLSVAVRQLNKPLLASGDRLSHTKTPSSKSFTVGSGIGWHEFGSTIGPTGQEKYYVLSGEARMGFTFRNQFVLSTGIGWRYYESYADSLENDENLRSDGVDPHNVFLLLGTEFLLGHMSLQVDGGINLHKPFFPHFADGFGEDNSWSYPLKRIILNRIGLNYYLIKTDRNPVHNVKVGAFVNANFGQADYMEVALSYIYNLK